MVCWCAGLLVCWFAGLVICLCLSLCVPFVLSVSSLLRFLFWHRFCVCLLWFGVFFCGLLVCWFAGFCGFGVCKPYVVNRCDLCQGKVGGAMNKSSRKCMESVLSQVCNFPYTFLCRRGGTRQTECLRGAREGRPWYQVELRCGTEVRIIVG